MAAYPTPKELKRLADACRKAGISHFKCGDLEFTLNENIPASTYKKKQAELSSAAPEFQTDSLSEDALLYWSTGADLNEEKTE